MTYKYWYTETNEQGLDFTKTRTDLIELGPFPLSTAQALKKIRREAELQGRRVLKIQRSRG